MRPVHEIKRGAIKIASSIGFCLLPISIASRPHHTYCQCWEIIEITSILSKVLMVIGEEIVITSNLQHRDIFLR